MSTDQSCNACEGPLRPWLSMPIDAKKNSVTPHDRVLRCTDCGLGVLSPLPPAESIPDFYMLDSYYTHGESHIKPVTPHFLDKVLNRLAWQADHEHPFDPTATAARLPAGGTICDLGCGHAAYLKAFRALGFQVTGVDPDPSARAQAAEAGIVVEEGTGEDLPAALAGRSFDLVIMTHSLEHCRDPRRALDNAFAITAPGGYAYIEVPNCASEHFRTFTICSEMFDAPRHIYFFTPDALGRLMQRVGFVPVETHYRGYARNFSPSWRGWERTIAQRVEAVDPAMKPRHHDLAASAALLLRSFRNPPGRKYDSIGFLMQRPTDQHQA